MVLSKDNQVVLEKLEVSPFFENTYLFGRKDTKSCIIIDPGDEAAKILKTSEFLGLEIKTILLTHGHLDHVAGCGELKDRTGCEIGIHPLDRDMYVNASRQGQILGYPANNQPEPDFLLQEGEMLSLCGFQLDVIHTPGHTPGGVCFLTGDILFSGDLLFAGSIGRTDLPGGSYTSLIESVLSKVFTLPDDTLVLPGHGPRTAVGVEKTHNPFFV